MSNCVSNGNINLLNCLNFCSTESICISCLSKEREHILYIYELSAYSSVSSLTVVTGPCIKKDWKSMHSNQGSRANSLWVGHVLFGHSRVELLLCVLKHIKYKVSILAIFKSSVQWHQLHSRSCASITTVYFRSVFITPKRNSVTIKQQPSNPWWPLISFLSVDLCLLEMPHQWNHTILVPSCHLV